MTGPILFFPSLHLEVPSFRRPPRPDRASWRYDPVLRSRRYRDHLAGHLVDFLLVVLDRLADQGGAVPVRRVLFEEPVDQLEVLFLEPQCDPLVFVHPDIPRLDRERGMTLSYTSRIFSACQTL